MQYKLHSIFCAVAVMCSAGTMKAQTVTTFENIQLPSAESDFISTQATSGSYEFSDGNVKFMGTLESWGGYTGFNCSNYTDTLTEGFTNDKSAITGSGYDNSDNYGIVYLSANWPDALNESIPNGVKLINDAVGNLVAGFYITNTTYAYYHIKENYSNGDYYNLVIRGYANGNQVADSVVYTLASYADGDTVLIKDWQWVDLTYLGNIDSLSFQVFSSDDLTPFYFAYDNIQTTDGICDTISNLAASDVTENSATITWENNSLLNIAFTYEVAVDNSATLAPTGTVSTTSTLTYDATGLNSNTVYYAHVRTKCSDNLFANWDTVSFKTQPNTGLSQLSKNNLQFTIAPNPVSNQLQIISDQLLNVKIFDITGKEIMNANQVKNIDVSSLAAGAYWLRAYDNKAQKSGIIKFVKTNR